MLPSEAHPICRSGAIFLIAFAVDGGQTSSGPFVMVRLHYASRYCGWKGASLRAEDRVNGRSWPYEAGV